MKVMQLGLTHLFLFQCSSYFSFSLSKSKGFDQFSQRKFGLTKYKSEQFLNKDLKLSLLTKQIFGFCNSVSFNYIIILTNSKTICLLTFLSSKQISFLTFFFNHVTDCSGWGRMASNDERIFFSVFLDLKKKLCRKKTGKTTSLVLF